MSKMQIDKKKDRIAKIDKSIEKLTKLTQLEEKDGNFFSTVSSSLEGFTPAFLLAGIPATTAVEIFETMEPNQNGSKVKKVARIAGNCVLATPFIAASILLGAAPAAIVLPPVAATSAIIAAHNSAINKRIKKAPKRIEALQKEKAELLKDIKNLESKNEVCK